MRDILKSQSGTHSGTGLKQVKIDQNSSFGGGGEKTRFFHM
tara:strand:- start:1582 stop:1704 length:123 start_codon:yes stop_codon:yes gene_type:complete